MTNHQDFEGLVAGGALHALEPEDEQRLAAHLLTCHGCARIFADTASIGAALSELIPAEAPAQDLRARILAAAAAEPRQPTSVDASVHAQHVVATQRRASAGPADGSAGSGRPLGAHPIQRARLQRFQVRSRIAVGVLAAVVGIGVAVPVTWAISSGGGSSVNNSALADALTQTGAREMTLHGASANSPSVGKAVLNSNGVVLVASGLPVNDGATSVYVLWAADMHGTRTAVATFDVKGGAPVQLTATKLPFKASDISQMAVSYEPGRTAPSTPSDVILSGTTA